MFPYSLHQCHAVHYDIFGIAKNERKWKYFIRHFVKEKSEAGKPVTINHIQKALADNLTQLSIPAKQIIISKSAYNWNLKEMGFGWGRAGMRQG